MPIFRFIIITYCNIKIFKIIIQYSFRHIFLCNIYSTFVTFNIDSNIYNLAKVLSLFLRKFLPKFIFL